MEERDKEPGVEVEVEGMDTRDDVSTSSTNSSHNHHPDEGLSLREGGSNTTVTLAWNPFLNQTRQDEEVERRRRNKPSSRFGDASMHRSEASTSRLDSSTSRFQKRSYLDREGNEDADGDGVRERERERDDSSPEEENPIPTSNHRKSNFKNSFERARKEASSSRSFERESQSSPPLSNTHTQRSSSNRGGSSRLSNSSPTISATTFKNEEQENFDEHGERDGFFRRSRNRDGDREEIVKSASDSISSIFKNFEVKKPEMKRFEFDRKRRRPISQANSKTQEKPEVRNSNFSPSKWNLKDVLERNEKLLSPRKNGNGKQRAVDREDEEEEIKVGKLEFGKKREEDDDTLNLGGSKTRNSDTLSHLTGSQSIGQIGTSNQHFPQSNQVETSLNSIENSSFSRSQRDLIRLRKLRESERRRKSRDEVEFSREIVRQEEQGVDHILEDLRETDGAETSESKRAYKSKPAFRLYLTPIFLLFRPLSSSSSPKFRILHF